MGSVLGSKDCAANNAADTACADEGGGAESAFPLTADVVGLPGKDARDVCVCGSGSEEDAKVSGAGV